MTKFNLAKVLALAAFLAFPALAPALAEEAPGGEGVSFGSTGPVTIGTDRLSAVQYNDGTRWVEPR